nr:MAG TPA: hypothetical protein [Caudoviricetes sp.]DAY34052.1 MAG TPA: hypothetical protein [Caudoviricetes sp.]
MLNCEIVYLMLFVIYTKLSMILSLLEILIYLRKEHKIYLICTDIPSLNLILRVDGKTVTCF